jgi:divalent metal cation (Fe/Co/Zn/Cd) transporter
VEETTIQTIAQLLTSGGSAITIFAVFIAWKAGQTAKDAVNALIESRTLLQEIRDAVLKAAPVLQESAEVLDRIEKRTQSMDLFVAEYNARALAMHSGRAGAG